MKTTKVKLVLVIEDEQNTSYTIVKEVSAPVLDYIKSISAQALEVMMSGLVTAPKKHKI